MDWNMLGPVLSLAFATVGSSIGCGITGLTSHAVMARVEEGHGKFIALAATPSSIAIYGFLLMLLMSRAIQAGTLAPMNAAVIGLFCGISFLLAATFMGMVAAAGIQASAKQPSVFGKTFASIFVIESVALFTFVFALMLI